VIEHDIVQYESIFKSLRYPFAFLIEFVRICHINRPLLFDVKTF